MNGVAEAPRYSQAIRQCHEFLNRQRFRSPGRIDTRLFQQCLATEAFQALAQHLAALAEGGLRYLLKLGDIAGQRLFLRQQVHDGGGHLWWRAEGLRRNVEGHFPRPCASR